MTSYTSAAGRKLTAVDPSEIVILIRSSSGENLEIPCKSVQPKRSIKLTPELATGSHLPRGLTVGDIGYEISFTVGTFVNDPAGERNATMWNNLLTEHLEYPEDEGIPKYFTIRLTDRRTGKQIMAFEYCRLQEDGWNIGQPGTTTEMQYNCLALRRILGETQELEDNSVGFSIYPTEDAGE
jgi:hypothetical protein